MTATVVSIFPAAGYGEQIQAAAEVLAGGGIVVFPTETVYGAAALFTHSAAARRLQSAFDVPDPRPLTPHLGNPDLVRLYVGKLSRTARTAVQRLWPGPVALVFEVSPDARRRAGADLGIDPSLICVGDTITLRCPDSPVAADLLKAVGQPVGVRRAGDDSGGIDPAWLDKADLVLDAGSTRYAAPSTVVRLHRNGYHVIRAGVYDQRTIERLMKTTILFVCSGNTCRSPMAEAIARQTLAAKLVIPPEELENHGIQVLSAGALTLPGARASEQAVEAVREFGCDLSRHRSRQLTVDLINQATVIYTMSRSHFNLVNAMTPTAAGKASTLSPNGDIEDPIGGNLALYQALARRMKTLIEQRLAELPIWGE